jgi:hypothetical protein
MDLNITAQSYKQINVALINAKDLVPASGIWLDLHSEYNIGIRQGNHIALSAKSRIEIANLVKKSIGLDPRKHHYSDLKAMSRTQVSALTKDEKLISLPPREKFVEVRLLIKDYCAPGYQGMLVDDVLALDNQCIISIENFDTFSNIQRGDLNCTMTLSGQTMCVVFAGDTKANPKAVKALMTSNTTPWIHYGDYDPAGLHIGMVRLKVDYIIVPKATERERLLALSNEKVHKRQYVQLNIIKAFTQPEIAEHITFIKKNNIAVMQEQLISHQVGLILIKVH